MPKRLIKWARYEGYTWTGFQGYWRHNLRLFSWTCKHCRKRN